MYRIIDKKDESVMTYAEPTFIKVLENGNYTDCLYAEATGVIVKDTIYALAGDEDKYPEGTGVVAVEKIDGGVPTYEGIVAQANTDEILSELLILTTCGELGVDPASI